MKWIAMVGAIALAVAAWAGSVEATDPANQEAGTQRHCDRRELGESLLTITEKERFFLDNVPGYPLEAARKVLAIDPCRWEEAAVVLLLETPRPSDQLPGYGRLSREFFAVMGQEAIPAFGAVWAKIVAGDADPRICGTMAYYASSSSREGCEWAFDRLVELHASSWAKRAEETRKKYDDRSIVLPEDEIADENRFRPIEDCLITRGWLTTTCLPTVTRRFGEVPPHLGHSAAGLLLVNGPEHVTFLLDGFSSFPAGLKEGVVRAMGMYRRQLGPHAPRVAALMAEQMIDGETELTRIWAAEGLQQIGGAAESALPALSRALRPPASHEVRNIAALAIAQLGEKAAAALPAMVEAARQEGPAIDDLAAAFAGVGEPALDSLVGLLTAPEERARGVAAEAFRLMGGRAAPAVPALRKALNDPANRRSRLSGPIGEALAAATDGAEKLEPEFVALLKGTSAETRMSAILSLQKLTAALDDDAGDLRRKLRSREEDRRLSAAARIGGLKLEERELDATIVALNAALADPSDDVRFVALVARMALELQRRSKEEDPAFLAATRKALELPGTSDVFRQLAIGVVGATPAAP